MGKDKKKLTHKSGKMIELEEMNIILRIPKEAVSLEVIAQVIDENGELMKVSTKLSVSDIHDRRQDFLDNVEDGDDYYEKNGLRWDFDCVVIDELSSFKNHQSQRFKWLRKIRPFVRRWIGLTGTPTSNGLMDLWAEIGILDGGERLGRFIGRFRESYFKPGAMNPSTGVVFSYVPRPGAEEQIYERISDITISMKALDYIVFDVETPNRYNNRMSAIGINVVEDGAITDSFFSYVNPESFFDYFNTRLTGIDEDTVRNAPIFPELWETIEPIFSSGILCAHNAVFDMGVLKKCLTDYEITWRPTAKYCCTVQMGRRLLPGISHKLNDLCNYYDIALDHHQADSDSRAAAEILLRYFEAGANERDFIRTYRL